MTRKNKCCVSSLGFGGASLNVTSVNTLSFRYLLNWLLHSAIGDILELMDGGHSTTLTRIGPITVTVTSSGRTATVIDASTNNFSNTEVHLASKKKAKGKKSKKEM